VISKKAQNKSSQGFTKASYHSWKDSESLFEEITGAAPTTRLHNLQHVDFVWGKWCVDVKGFKKSQREGYVLVEFLNVQGRAGWASKDAKSTHIAFQMEDHFLIVGKNALRDHAISLAGTYTQSKVKRSHRPQKNGYAAIVNQYLGREGRQDVYVYISRDELQKISHDILPIPKSLIS
jgi:hypothetical protein